MSGKSPIEWTEHTWNPIVGCSVLSPGCKKCYAMKMAARIEAMGFGTHYAGTTKKVNGQAVWTGELRQAPEHILVEPLHRKKPTTYFVNSMGDLFHEDCPDEWIDRVFAVMALCPQHAFQILTKRAERMRDYCARTFDDDNSEYEAQFRVWCHLPKFHIATLGCDPPRWPLPNVWLGVSAERQQEADERIPFLLQTPAAIRFISAEPLLGAINLTRVCLLPQKPDSIRAGIHLNVLAGKYYESGMPYHGDWDVTGPAPAHRTPSVKLDWVIIGGESGGGAREFDIGTAHVMIVQCRAHATPVFVKQLGAFPIQWSEDGHSIHRLHLKNRKGGDPSEWPEYLRVRKMPLSTKAEAA